MYYLVCYFNRGTLRDKSPTYLFDAKNVVHLTHMIDPPFIEH